MVWGGVLLIGVSGDLFLRLEIVLGMIEELLRSLVTGKANERGVFILSE